MIVKNSVPCPIGSVVPSHMLRGHPHLKHNTLLIKSNKWSRNITSRYQSFSVLLRGILKLWRVSEYCFELLDFLLLSVQQKRVTRDCILVMQLVDLKRNPHLINGVPWRKWGTVSKEAWKLQKDEENVMSHLQLRAVQTSTTPNQRIVIKGRSLRHDKQLRTRRLGKSGV